MRKFKGLKWAFATMLIATSLQAADIIIDNQTIPGSDIQSIVINPASGNIFVTTNSGYDVTPSGSPPPTTSSVAITAFSASPASINEGETVQLSWSTSNAASCTASGDSADWSGNVAVPNGSKTITLSTAGTYTFTLTCNGSNSDTDIKYTTVTVSTPLPQTNNCPTPALSGGNILDWSSFWGVPFPQPGYQNSYASVAKYSYLSLRFNTGNIVDDGKISSIETTQTDGVRLGAISQCPGVFDVAPECDYIWGISGGIRWATNGRDGACQLQPNTTYYFNITFTDGVIANTTTCNAVPCVTTLQAVNR